MVEIKVGVAEILIVWLETWLKHVSRTIAPPQRVLVSRRISTVEWLFVPTFHLNCVAKTSFYNISQSKRLHILTGLDLNRVSSWVLVRTTIIREVRCLHVASFPSHFVS